MMIKNASFTSDSLNTVTFQLSTTHHNRVDHISSKLVKDTREDLVNQINGFISTRNPSLEDVNIFVDIVTEKVLQQPGSLTIQDAAAFLSRVSIGPKFFAVRELLLEKRSFASESRDKMICKMKADSTCRICQEPGHWFTARKSFLTE